MDPKSQRKPFKGTLIFSLSFIAGLAFLTPIYWYSFDNTCQLSQGTMSQIMGEATMHNVDISCRKNIFLSYLITLSLLSIVLLITLKKLGSGINFNQGDLLDSSLIPKPNLWSMFLLVLLISFAHFGTGIGYYEDYFEMANSANTTQRIRDGQWPFIDYLSSHLLSEQIGPAFFYAFSDKPLGWIAFDFWKPLLNGLVIYFFLRKFITNDWWTIGLLTLFPFSQWLFPKDFVLALIPLMLIIQSSILDTKKWVALWLVTFGLCFWKIDVGIGALCACLSLGTYLSWQKQGSSWRAFLLGFSIVLAVLVLIFGVLHVFNGYMLAQLKDTLAYFTADQAHGRAVLTYWEKDYKYHFHYFIAPVLLVFLAGLALVRGGQKHFLLSFLFLTAFYLANFQRGIVRHSFTSGTDVYVSSFAYLLLTLYVLYFFYNKPIMQKPWQKTLVLLMAASVFIWALKPGNDIKKPSIAGKLYDRISSKDFTWYHPNWEVQLSRSFAEEVAPFKAYLDQNLAPNQSFIDLSNRPLLYYHTQRLIPSYFNQFLQNTVTPYQQQKAIKLFQTLDLPIVLYQYHPKAWLDQTDGIPNSLRYHIIHDYILANYHPLGLLGSKILWLHNSLPDSLYNSDLQPIPYSLETLDLGNIPRHYAPEGIILNKESVKDSIPPFTNKQGINSYLEVTFDSQDSHANSITFFHLDQSWTIRFTPADTIRIPIDWMVPRPNHFQIDTKASTTLISHKI